MDDVLQAKATTIERCMVRIREEGRQDWKNDYSHQDALLLNLERACQAAIDAASHLVRIKKLGMPKMTRELFDLLENSDLINPELSVELKKMVGFRNLAIHDYASLNMDVIESIITKKLLHLEAFAKILVTIT